MARGSRQWMALVITLFFIGEFSGAYAGEKAKSVESLLIEVKDGGSRGRLKDPLAKVIGVEDGADFFSVVITSAQTSDHQEHDFILFIDSQTQKAASFSLRVSSLKDGISEIVYFNASLNAALMSANFFKARINPKPGAKNRFVKDTSEFGSLDIESPETKARFQYELDVFLNRSHIKKEWRAGVFSAGRLKKR